MSEASLKAWRDAYLEQHRIIRWHEKNSGVSVSCARCGGMMKECVEPDTMEVCEPCDDLLLTND